MILMVCLPCALTLRVMPANAADAMSDDELETLVGRKSSFWPDKFPCPVCDAHMTGMREQEADPKALQIMTLRDLTPQEAFAAFHGLGFPEEQACDFPLVRGLLAAHPVRQVIGKTIAQTTRTVIDAIELWDGTKLYLGAAAEGAIVYRITRPHSYVKALEEGAAVCPSR